MPDCFVKLNVYKRDFCDQAEQVDVAAVFCILIKWVPHSNLHHLSCFFVILYLEIAYSHLSYLHIIHDLAMSLVLE
jgi:hypothetical protein